MEYKKTVVVRKCDRCGVQIRWSGNEAADDFVKSKSGQFDYCQNCFLEMEAIQQLEAEAYERGVSGNFLAKQIMARYED
jgi:hypothetical protein